MKRRNGEPIGAMLWVGIIFSLFAGVWLVFDLLNAISMAASLP